MDGYRTMLIWKITEKKDENLELKFCKIGKSSKKSENDGES